MVIIVGSDGKNDDDVNEKGFMKTIANHRQL